MDYMVDFGIWNSVFVVPSCIVDDYIKLANSSQIKVLLWVLRNAGSELSLQKISGALSIHESDVLDAIEYWSNVGILSGDRVSLTVKEHEDRNVLSESNEEVSKEIIEEGSIDASEIKDKKSSRPRAISRKQKPGSNYISQRIAESEEIAFLMQESQIILGRPISSGDCAALLTLHDNDGLPVDVIIMVLQYAVGIGKSNMNYIEKVGISWACNGIDTLEKAEKHIKALDQSNKAWGKFMNITGIECRAPSPSEQEAVNRWINIWGYSDDMIREAYNRCIDSKGTCILKYIDGIIKRWKEQGIYNLEQVMENTRSRAASKKSKKISSAPSYDIEEYENYSIFDEIG